MEILDCSYRFNTDLTIRKEWIPQITFATNYEIEILENFSKLSNANAVLLELMHFTNPCIESIDISSWTYIVNRNNTKKRLPIARFSRGEKLLALCLMADMTKHLVFVCFELSQLSKPSMQKLMCDFRDSDYIRLIPPTPTTQHILESLIERR